jgi:hypothetical protein
MPVLVGTEAGLFEVGTGRPVAFDGRDVRALSGPWALVDGNVASRTADGEVPVPGPRPTCLAGTEGSAPWVGTEEAHLLRVDGQAAPVESFETAQGRDKWYTPWGGPPAVRSVSVTPQNSVLVNVHVGGILRTDDDGASWQPTIDIDADVHQVLGLAGGAAVAACAYGLATSADDGLTWKVDDEGLHAAYSRAVAVAGDTVLLSASSGPGGHQAAVYRRPLGSGGAFERCRTGLPEWFEGNVDTTWLVGGHDGSAAFATRDGRVYLSTDEGATWELVATGLPAVRCVSLEG